MLTIAVGKWVAVAAAVCVYRAIAQTNNTVTSAMASSAAASPTTVSPTLASTTMASPTLASTTMASSMASVPTGTALNSTDGYAGKYRPQVHFSPPTGFMNDPNGLFKDAKGLWHLYYQYNPTALVAGNQHWGHATSRDLYHWQNEQIALYPPAADVGVFSGSAVVDTNNTSGFFPNQTDGVVAIYTLNYPGRETQDIAYSTDGGYTFTPYEGNPVLDLPEPNPNFRDPKVIRYGDKWIMAVAVPHEYVVQFYSSDNLKNWTLESNFTRAGLLGDQYECPNLVQVPVRNDDGSDAGEMWVLVISINPGGPLGGSSTEYFPGEFNGTHFTPVDGGVRFADWNKDDYAGQFFWEGPGHETTFIAWASNWQYTNVVPTDDEGWRSMMSLPKTVHIQNATREAYNLIQVPYDLSPIMGQQLASSSGADNSTNSSSLSLGADFFDDATSTAPCNSTGSAPSSSNTTSSLSGAVLVQVNVSGIVAAELEASASVNITFSSADKSQVVKTGYLINNWIWLDRSGATAFDSPLFNDKFSAWYLVRPSMEFSLTVVVDRSIIEVFLDDGALLGSSVFFATQPLTSVDVAVGGIGSARAEAAVWGLTGTWNMNGTTQ